MRRPIVVSLLVGLLLVAPASAEPPEVLRYRWNLGGFFGLVARLFLPGHGHGTLVTRQGEETLEVELEITAPDAAQGEFWRYGAVIDPDDGRTLTARSAYRYRGESKSTESDLEDAAVIDVASGILLLRRDPPSEPRDMRIWNDGKIYPVVIIPNGYVLRSVGDRQRVLRHFAIRARDVPGERLWKGQLDIYLADDEHSTPVEIDVERRMARVRLLLQEEETPDAG